MQLKVTNLSGNPYSVGPYGFEPGVSFFPGGLPDLILRYLDSTNGLVVYEEVGDIPASPPPLVEDSAHQVDYLFDRNSELSEFEQLNTMRVQQAVEVIEKLDDRELLSFVAKEAKRVTVQQAAEERLKQLDGITDEDGQDEQLGETEEVSSEEPSDDDATQESDE